MAKMYQWTLMTALGSHSRLTTRTSRRFSSFQRFYRVCEYSIVSRQSDHLRHCPLAVVRQFSVTTTKAGYTNLHTLTPTSRIAHYSLCRHSQSPESQHSGGISSSYGACGVTFHTLSAADSTKSGDKQTGSKEPSKGPNLDQLTNVQNFMLQQIPTVLSKTHEYRIYTKDLVFQNNWNLESPKKTIGITSYVWAVIKARFYVHSRYAKVKVTVVSSSVDEERGFVQMRWRVAGLAQSKAFMFWKFRPFQIKKKGREDSEWLEGLSTFYVNNSGFIYRHILDRVIPDVDKSTEIKKPVLGVGAS